MPTADLVSPLSILLVEDSPVIRHRLVALLAATRDLRVVGTASAPAEALAEVDRLAPDAILLDLKLRGGSGLDVLRALRAVPDPPPVVVLTALPTEEHRQGALAAGAVAVLDKQSQFEAVPAALRDAVRRRDRTRALESLPLPVMSEAPDPCGRCLFTELVEATADLVAMDGDEALKALPRLLERVGTATRSDRGYVYVADEVAGSYRLLHAWRNPARPASPEPLAEVPMGIFGWGEGRFRAFRPVVISDPSDLPPEASIEKALLERQGIRSWLGVPLRQGNRQYGFLAFDTLADRRSWPPMAVTLTQLIGQVSAAVVERRQSDARLRESESTLRALVDSSPLGILRADAAGRLERVNLALARILGFQEVGELLDLGCLEPLYAHPGERAGLLRELERHGAITGREVEMRRHDGTPLTVVVSSRVVRDETGRLVAYEAFVEDVTERRRLEASLRQSQRAELLGQLSGGLAHDLGNLLTVVAASASLLEMELGDAPDPVARELDALNGAIARARELLLRLMAVGHSRVFDRRPVDLASTVDETARLLRRVLPENIQVVVDGAYEPMMVFADRGALEQVLMNLATNARDAMPGGGRLIFRLRRQGGEQVLEVEDTGTGIPREALPRIFEPFFTTKPAGRGTGLGLPMVRSIVEHCRGSLAVESETGRGTRFIIRCPAYAGPVPRPAAGPAARRAGGRERILLVEDQPEIRRVAQRLLERAGYQVELSDDGRGALARLTAGGAPIQLVITDVVMPYLSGLELFEACRWLPHRPRFLFTSGYARQELPEMGEGLATFVQKPWTRDELLARVRETLDRPAMEVAA